MFSTGLKFAVDCLMGWFVKKIKSVYLELDLQTKILHESKNPLDWEKGKWVICNFPLHIDVTGVDSSTAKMSYY